MPGVSAGVFIAWWKMRLKARNSHPASLNICGLEVHDYITRSGDIAFQPSRLRGRKSPVGRWRSRKVLRSRFPLLRAPLSRRLPLVRAANFQRSQPSPPSQLRFHPDRRPAVRLAGLHGHSAHPNAEHRPPRRQRRAIPESLCHYIYLLCQPRLDLHRAISAAPRYRRFHDSSHGRSMDGNLSGTAAGRGLLDRFHWQVRRRRREIHRLKGR